MRFATLLVLSVFLGWGAGVTLAQETGGIGVALKEDHGRIVITKVIQDSPAAASGELHEGDQILTVASGDGEPVSVSGKRMGDAQRLIKGPQGTTVRLKIIPKGKTESDAREVSLVRADVKGVWGDGKLLAAGADAPDVTFVRLGDDKDTKLSDYRGKPLVLVFWASWCGPCQQEMADLQTVYEKHPQWKDKVTILTASIDEKKEDAVKRLKEKSWDKTTNLLSDIKTLRAFHIDGIPASYVIDANGKVAAADPRDVVEAVTKLLTP